jgi:hypothetical protein
MIGVNFYLGDKIKVKETGKIGEIKAYKVEGFYHGGQIVNTIKYYIRFEPYANLWLEEKDISYEHTYEFPAKFELNLLNLLIDINLDRKDFEMVKQLNELRQQHMKG